MNERDFAFRRNTAVKPVWVPAGDTASKVPVPDLRQIEGITSFGVDNTFPIFIRLVGTGFGAAAFNAANDGEGWVFGPGKHGAFSTQFPEFMSAIAVDRPGYPIRDGAGNLRFPQAGLEVFYGSGTGGAVGYSNPFVTVLNLPATQAVSGTVNVSGSVAVTGKFWPDTQPISGSVTVSNFPATQQVSGSVSVTNFPATQPVSGTVAVSNFPATQPVSGTVTANVTFPATQQVADAGGTLTVDTGTAGIFADTPSSLAAHAITPVVAVGQTGLIAKASAGNLYSASAVGANSGAPFYLLSLNRTTIPVAASPITAAEVLGVTMVPSGGTGTINPDELPDRHSVGIVILCSTSTTIYTPPAQAPLHLKARVA